MGGPSLVGALCVVIPTATSGGEAEAASLIGSIGSATAGTLGGGVARMVTVDAAPSGGAALPMTEAGATVLSRDAG